MTVFEKTANSLERKIREVNFARAGALLGTIIGYFSFAINTPDISDSPGVLQDYFEAGKQLVNYMIYGAGTGFVAANLYNLGEIILRKIMTGRR